MLDRVKAGFNLPRIQNSSPLSLPIIAAEKKEKEKALLSNLWYLNAFVPVFRERGREK